MFDLTAYIICSQGLPYLVRPLLLASVDISYSGFTSSSQQLEGLISVHLEYGIAPAFPSSVKYVMLWLARSTPRDLLRRLPSPGVFRTQIFSSAEPVREGVYIADPASDKLDRYLETIATRVAAERVSLQDLYKQYQNQAGAVIDRIVPYEETPAAHKRADQLHRSLDNNDGLEGDGIVMVVHACLAKNKPQLLRTAVCSGFVVDARQSQSQRGDLVVTCAHALEEVYRYICRSEESPELSGPTLSFIVPSSGPPRVVSGLLSSMPRSDVIVLEVVPQSSGPRLRPLPVTPFPVYRGTPVLTHLFGSPDPPPVQHSMARTQLARPVLDPEKTGEPIPWVSGHAWRRWGSGTMLGYRSYTGIELEAGISSVLPHILTSVLPTSGSSGGPLVNGETGCVVGMTSGRRMDNRVEGERGWGCSSEGIFEMFSLPGFMPSAK